MCVTLLPLVVITSHHKYVVTLLPLVVAEPLRLFASLLRLSAADAAVVLVVTWPAFVYAFVLNCCVLLVSNVTCRCWSADPAARPSISKVLECLQLMIQVRLSAADAS
jgi:hypothetical protein